MGAVLDKSIETGVLPVRPDSSPDAGARCQKFRVGPVPTVSALLCTSGGSDAMRASMGCDLRVPRGGAALDSMASAMG